MASRIHPKDIFLLLSSLFPPNIILSTVLDEVLFREVQRNVREQIGLIASLGGKIQGKGVIPKTSDELNDIGMNE